MGKADQRGGHLGEVRSFIGQLDGSDLHAKRIDALAGATLGVIAAASLAVAIMSQALAQARDLVTKHAVKQVGRLLAPAQPARLAVPDMLQLQTEPLADCSRYDHLRQANHVIH